MKLDRNELLNIINDYLKIETFEDYCPNGLQVEGSSHIKKIAFSVSATIDSIQKSVQWGADTLIVHHGIFWKYQSGKPAVGAHYQRLSGLIKNDINLVAYHLPLDGHQEIGNAKKLADFLELEIDKPFGEYKRSFTGISAKLPKPLKAKEFKDWIEKKLARKIIHASSDASRLIKTVGIITGGANNDWTQAQKSGLDAYLTGEISEYNWHDAIEANVDFYACGHHTTEKFGINGLKNFIEEKFKKYNIETCFFDSENPA